MTPEHPRPFVSVIVPVLNMPRAIRRCVEALLAQSYPRDRYEIIIVDNGSTDDTVRVIGEYPARLLVEQDTQSPYAARNLGLRHAKGEIIALTDADCTPMPDWIERGVEALDSGPADLIGGHVRFLFSPKRTAAEMYDSIANLEMKNSITLRGEAKTGNLFARRKVFDTIGDFPGQTRSGGDRFWTGRASRSGFKLLYNPDVVVGKEARPLLRLLKKSYRIGKGTPAVWLDRHRGVPGMGKSLVRDALPPPPSGIRNQIIERGTPDMKQRFAVLWFVAWLCGLSNTAGRLHGFFVLLQLKGR